MKASEPPWAASHVPRFTPVSRAAAQSVALPPAAAAAAVCMLTRRMRRPSGARSPVVLSRATGPEAPTKAAFRMPPSTVGLKGGGGGMEG